jgi:hypothetical protein
MSKLITLRAYHRKTGQLLVCCIDLSNIEQADRLWCQFDTYLARKGYVLEGTK